MLHSLVDSANLNSLLRTKQKKSFFVCRFKIKCYLCTRKTKVTGCSSARLEYASGGRVVAGSNPVTPTGENEGVKSLT